MEELTQLEKDTLKKIIEEMKECGMFIGRYDPMSMEMRLVMSL